MIKQFLFLLFATCVLTVSGQNAYFKNLDVLTGLGETRAKDIRIDSDGNTILFGTFFGTLDLDPGPNTVNVTANSTGSVYPSYIIKLDTNGNYLWGGVLEQTYYQTAKIQLDDSNNIYVAGMFKDSMDFDISFTNKVMRYTVAPYDDAFLVKISPNGNYKWVKTFGRGGSITIKDFSIDHAGNFLFAGACEGGNIVYHPNASTPTYNAYFTSYYVLKYNANGNFSWVKQFGKSGEYGCEQIEVTSTNDIIVGGQFQGTIDFNPGSGVFNLTSNLGSTDIWLLKLDPLGNFQWAKQIGNSSATRPFDMQVDINDNLLMTGEFQGTVDFNPGTGIFNETSKQWLSRFVLKLRADTAAFVWVRSFVLTDPFNVNFYDLYTDTIGNVYTTGTFKKEFYVHPDTSVNANTLPSSSQSTLTWYDAFLHKFDSAGTFQWARSINANEFQAGKAVTTDGAGNVIWFGDFNGTANFGLGAANVQVTATGSRDGFVLGLGQCSPIYFSETDTACNYYISFLGDTVTQSGQYQFVYSDTLGCDSIVTLDLTVIAIDTTIIVDSTSMLLTAAAQNAIYQWFDCTSGFLPIANATNASFQPVANGSYAVSITTPNGCTDTSACINVSTIGITEFINSELKLFPNPTTGKLRVNSNGAILNIVVLDILGNQLLQQNAPDIDLTNLPAGVYLVKVQGENGTTINRIVKH